MAIISTGAIYKSLVFDGESSRDYGIYITGQAVYNAPERDVEMINIPGRNGSFALDKGRFQNIEVTYPAGIFADNEADFAQGISEFRNFLCSRNGYVRLTDEYNPDEYRMAVYKSGLEVSPAQLKAGEFQLVFDCKPQRYLLSGEEPVMIGEWRETETASGEIASFEAEEGDAVKSLIADIEPIQSLNGYDKPWSGGNGKNKFEPTHLTEYKNESGASFNGFDLTSLVSFLNTLNEGTYTISFKFKVLETVSGATSWGILLQNSVSGYIDGRQNGQHNSGEILTFTRTVTITAENKGHFTHAYLYSGGGNKANVYWYDFQLEEGSTATAYEPYSNICPISGYDSVVVTVADDHDSPTVSNTYTIDLNGTRYGGTLDVASGVLTVDRAIVDLGTKEWTHYSVSQGHLFRTTQDGIKQITVATDTINAISDRYVAIKQADRANGTMSCSVNTNNIDIINNNYTDATAFKTAMDGAQLVYELATPQTVQLTAEEVELLAGLNQIWANSGDVEVEYGTAPNVVYNPTRFESSPMLEVWGHGDIGFNGYGITINDVIVGDIETSTKSSPSIPEQSAPFTNSKTIDYSAQSGAVNAGDSLFISSIKTTVVARYLDFVGATPSPTITSDVGTPSVSATVYNYQSSSPLTILWARYTLNAAISDIELTAFTDETHTATVTLPIRDTSNVLYYTEVITVTITNTESGVLTISVTYGGEDARYGNPIYTVSLEYGRTYLYSTKSILGSPLYVDCDLGEAYKYEGETIVSINQHVDLGSDLPKLGTDANEITHSDTITALKVAPRWWKI